MKKKTLSVEKAYTVILFQDNTLENSSDWSEEEQTHEQLKQSREKEMPYCKIVK